MKKLLSLVLVAAMLASMLVFVPAAGATEPLAKVEAGSAVATPGATVSVPVTITASVLPGFSILCEYDGERLEWLGADFSPVDKAGTKAGYAVPSNGDAVYDNWYANGSFASFAWASAVSGGETIAADGLVVVNLQFKVKDDAPIGDAYVNIPTYGAVNKAGETIYGTLVKVGDEVVQGDAIACTNGKVTVLPEGWFDVTPTDEAEFTINASGTLTKYLGDASVVVIPASVKTIAKGAFNGKSLTAVVIPASVTSIAKGAFINCQSMTDAYIMGADTELSENCMGFNGNVPNKGAVRIDGCIYTDPEVCDETLLKIHSVPNNSVDAYVAEGDGYVDEDTGEALPTEFGYSEIAAGANVTIGANTFYAPVVTTTPGQMLIDGKTVVAWKRGDKTYAPGAPLAVEENIVLEPVGIVAPVTLSTIGFKGANLPKNVGMRFSATMSIDDYAALAEFGTVELGMMITPAVYVSKAGAFTKGALDALGAKNGAYVDIKLGGYFDKTETDYVFAGHLTNFSNATFAKNPNFVAVMYATVTIDGVATTVYSQYNWAGMHNIKDAANAVIASAPVTDGSVAVLKELVKKFS